MQLVVNIVVLAAIYALIACGYVLIYRVSRVLNLAHGELMMLGAYLLLTTASTFSGNAFVAVAAAIALSLVVGVLVYLFLMRKMAGETVLAAVLTTVALGILLRGLMILIWSAQQQYPGQALALANPGLALPGGGTLRADLEVLGFVSQELARQLGRTVPKFLAIHITHLAGFNMENPLRFCFSWFNFSSSSPRARCRRDRTVPIGHPRTSAASA